MNDINKKIEKIYMLVDLDNTIEGLLIKYKEKGTIKYYSEEIITEYDIKRINDFCETIVKLLFNSEYNKKTEFIYCDDENYMRIYDSIFNENDLKSKRGFPYVNVFSTILGGLTSLTGEIGFVFQLIGTLSSIASIRHLNQSIELLGKTTRKKLLRKIYATTLGINLLFGSLNGYHELTKTQLERDIDDFLVNKDHSIDNPFDSGKEFSDKEKIELLMNAINENPYLRENDKEILYKFKSFLEENPYIEYKELYEYFISLGIIYTEEKSDENSRAAYFPEDNYIIDYNSKNEKYGSKYEFYDDDIYHPEEIGYQIMRKMGSFDDYKGLEQGMAELLSSEYLTDSIPNNHYGNVIITRLMIEIVGKEKILAAYMTNNFDIIKKELKRINGSEEDFNKLATVLKKEYCYKENVSYQEVLEIDNAFSNYVKYLVEESDDIDENLERRTRINYNLLVLDQYIIYGEWAEPYYAGIPPTYYNNDLKETNYQMIYKRSN